MRREAARFGKKRRGRCPNCGQSDGLKLTKFTTENLQEAFFSYATAPHTYQGFVPVLRIGGDGDDYVKHMPSATQHDWQIIKSKVGGSLFYASPRLFLLGITNHFAEGDGEILTDSTIREVVDKLRTVELAAGTEFFRIRLNLDEKKRFQISQFDSPPTGKRSLGRFDNQTKPILYASPSLIVCIHETRVTLADEIFVATLKARRMLKFVDLSDGYIQDEFISPFDDLRYFFGGLMLSSNTYENCRKIADYIRRIRGVDGIIYNSFFTNVADGPIDGPRVNYGIFGKPLRARKLEISSINSVRLETVEYGIALGPIFK